LADRIDLHVAVRAVAPAELSSRQRSEPSAAIRARVIAARERQLARYAGDDGVRTNAQASARRLLDDPGTDGDMRAALATLTASSALSARGFDRVLRVARTIADLAGRSSLAVGDLHEAVRYRGS
jgi:magnesium chelatase family protein